MINKVILDRELEYVNFSGLRPGQMGLTKYNMVLMRNNSTDVYKSGYGIDLLTGNIVWSDTEVFLVTVPVTVKPQQKG